MCHVLGWPKISFGFFDKMVQKNLNKLFSQPNIIAKFLKTIMINVLNLENVKALENLWTEWMHVHREQINVCY